MVPNAIAYLMLGLWPLVAIGLFRWLPPGRALLANLFLSYLFLPPPPTQFDLPLLPPLDKENLPALSLLLACLIHCRDQLSLPRTGWVAATLAVFIFSPVLTVFANTDGISFGAFGLPGLGVKDALSLVINRFSLVLPMLLSYALLRSTRDLRDVLLAFALFGLIYSLPMLIEVRLSPQLNIWIYGYFQHNFDQMMRFGGFRPIVFLYHGLWVAFFAMSAVIAAATLTRTEDGPERAKAFMVMMYLMVILVLCKSVGPLLYAMLLLPLVLLLPLGTQLRVALAFASVAIAYPIIKGAGWLPEEALLQLASRISEERASSLQFRLNNESSLLERAMERPILGWGSWGRNQILDPFTGQELLVSDGRWVITLGFFGWVGFAAEMLLLAAPIVMLWVLQRGQNAAQMSAAVGGMALLLAINLIDLLPNATLTPLTWLLTGALLRHAEELRQNTAQAFNTQGAAPKRRKSGLTSVM